MLLVPAGDKMLIERDTVCKSSHLWGWDFSLYFDLACGSCPGWEAEPQFWCFLGRVPNVIFLVELSAMSVAVDIPRRAEEEEEDEAGSPEGPWQSRGDVAQTEHTG